jgi:serine/threonine protein kinase
MAKEQDAAVAHGAAVDETLPQWQPPAGATRVGVSGARLGEAAVVEHTMNAAIQPAGPPDPLAVGDTIGDRYVIEQHISSGGFGAVYRAQDRQIRNHQVALKLLHVPAADEAAREAALRELTLIASVSHPSVVQFKDYGWYQGRLWFAMPWYSGETLAMRFSDSAGLMPISRRVARPIFERTAQGLAAMHAVGIHHHDIKPENIFLADIAGFDAGFPVLLDLGIAGKRGEGPKGLTVEYASPETAAAALGNREIPVGSAADVFSLALVLRNFLEPETAPSTEGEMLGVLHRRANEPVDPPSKRELRYLKPAFKRWLSLDPNERPSAPEFAAELAQLTLPEERREARARFLRRIIPIVLLAAAAVAVLTWQVRKQKSEIIVQQQRLTQEMQESDQLRQRTADQLKQIEQKSQQIGSQGQQLQRALSIAHQLDQQLQTTEDRADNLNRKLRKTTDERDSVTLQRDALTQERDVLVATRDRLTRERDDLARARENLSRERDNLAAQRDRLDDQRTEALSQRDKLQDDLNATRKQLDNVKDERDAMRKSQDKLKDEVASLRDDVRDLKKQNDKLEDQRNDLKKDVEELKRKNKDSRVKLAQ